MTILFLEPFFTGSHRWFAEGLQRRSRHRIRLETLPGRFWKWRMRGAALEFARRLPPGETWDLVLAGNLMDLAQWKALRPDLSCPHLLYVHENQLAYPLKEGEERDFQYGWTDYVNMLCADKVIFNSAYNRSSFWEEFDRLAARLPDCRPDRDPAPLLEKSRIIPPGSPLPAEWKREEKCEALKKPPLILWNHRWEHDKDPAAFFGALTALKERGFPFRLALLGESYRESPSCFARARQTFREELVHYGYLPDRAAYGAWLDRADFVISTARQENFGLSVVEAAAHGALPLLPNRLAYPEVLPEKFHRDLIYADPGEIPDRVVRLSARPDLPRLREAVSAAMAPYSWEAVSARFDALFEEVLHNHGK